MLSMRSAQIGAAGAAIAALLVSCSSQGTEGTAEQTPAVMESPELTTSPPEVPAASTLDPSPTIETPNPLESPTPISEPTCLAVTALPAKVTKNVSEYGLPNGDDIFVEVRLQLTNNCVGPVKGFSGNIDVTDLFEFSVVNGTVKETIAVKPGETKKTKSGMGYFVDKFDDGYQSLLDADPADLTITYSPIVVILRDGTRLTPS